MASRDGQGRRSQLTTLRAAPRRRLQLERLEDRILLTTFFVDDNWGAVGPHADPDGPGGPATDFGVDSFATIQEAVDVANNGDIVQVNAGTYVENIHITSKNISLLSTDGRDVTTIEGISGAGALGTVVIEGTTNGVHLGGLGQGFKIIGIDNGAPGIENAAVYIKGNHTNLVVQGNEIVANGDEGLLSEYGATINGMTIDSNIFSGQTFVGSTAGGEGFGNQFTEANVPRQLVVIGGGSGGGNTHDVTFTNNQVTGTAGGINADGHEQGNSLVTIDSHGADISDNTFEGTTTRYGSALRSRGEDVTVVDNSFDASHMSGSTNYVDLINTMTNMPSVSPATLEDVIDANTFDQTVNVNPDGSIGVTHGNIIAKIGGSRLDLKGEDLTESYDVDIAFTQTGVILTGHNGTTINGDASLTLDNITLRRLTGRLGNNADHVNVTGIADKFELKLLGGDNSINFTEFTGGVKTEVDRRTGSLNFTAVDSRFIALNIGGGDSGNDVVTLERSGVVNRTTINLFDGQNAVVMNDDVFLGDVKISSKGAGTMVDIESMTDDDVGTRFERKFAVEVGESGVINVSSISDGDLVTFSGQAQFKGREPDALLDIGENVLFSSDPKLQHVVRVI